MIRPLARRDFVLDSGALSYLAADDRRIKLWLAHIESEYDEAMVFIPLVVVTEALTGDPRRDANVHRLLKRIAPAAAPDAIWLEPTLATTSRAAALRTQAITSGAASAKRPISVIDAHLVALAEVRSTINAVTILTSDRTDIQILVNLTGAKNVSVQIV